MANPDVSIEVSRMPDYAVALTPPAFGTGQRSNGYYQLYMNSHGTPFREGQLCWKVSKSRRGAFFEICYILRMYSPPNSDKFEVLADIMYGVNGPVIDEYRLEYAGDHNAQT